MSNLVRIPWLDEPGRPAFFGVMAFADEIQETVNAVKAVTEQTGSPEADYLRTDVEHIVREARCWTQEEPLIAYLDEIWRRTLRLWTDHLEEE